MARFALTCLFLSALSTACGPGQASPSPATGVPPTASASPVIPSYRLPAGFNPLTGQPVLDPSLLKTPALLVSISHFPALGRPQAGLSFAPFVYEISITEGASRFLAVLYGDFPAPEAPLTGECAVRTGVFSAEGFILGNRIWLDANANGQQDWGEPGVGGVCVNLYDAGEALLQATTSDSNGYYGFGVPAGSYRLEFVLPGWAGFSAQAQGEAGLDSNADPASGRADVQVASEDLTVDAGLVPLDGSASTPEPSSLPLAQVGPIRSGRVTYSYLADSFPKSCLVYAGASSDVLERLPICYMVYHQFAGGGYMLDIEELRSVARQNMRKRGESFEYGGYAFSESPPPGGVPADQLNVFYANLNQSGWSYDPLYRAYLRLVDTSEENLAGVLFPDRDRLTGRQLHFENVIVLFARHDVISPTNLDIRLNPGREGEAWLFRDGRAYEIDWRMPDEKAAVHALAFLGEDGRPISLRPGHTWVIVVTNQSELTQTSSGVWRALYMPPEGEAR